MEISVLVTCYDEGSLLCRAMKSLDSQTDKDFEIIIINDCSPDPRTNAICRELGVEGKASIIWRKENAGHAAAKNSGFEAMKGEIGVVLDADDELPQGAIADIRYAFNQFPQADYVFGDYILHNVEAAKERIVDCSVLRDSNGSIDPYILLKNWILYGTCPSKKAFWQRIGKYPLGFSFSLHDVDFWMKALLRGARGVYVNSVIYIWHKSEKGMNSRPETQMVMADLYFENLAFLNMYDTSGQMRLGIMRAFLNRGAYAKAKIVAMAMISSGQNSFIVRFIAYAPALAVQYFFLFYKALRKTKLIKPIVNATKELA